MHTQTEHRSGFDLSGSRPLTGPYLAHGRLSKVERAFLAADLFVGTRYLWKPTLTQAASLLRVSTAYAHTALHRPDDRWLIETGHTPLMPRTMKTPAVSPSMSIEEHMLAVVNRLGVNGALDLLAQIRDQQTLVAA